MFDFPFDEQSLNGKRMFFVSFIFLNYFTKFYYYLSVWSKCSIKIPEKNGIARWYRISVLTLSVEQDQSPGYHPGFQGVRPTRLLLVPRIRGCHRDRHGRSRALIRLRLTARRYRAICTLFSLFLLRLCNRKKNSRLVRAGPETMVGDRASGCAFYLLYRFYISCTFYLLIQNSFFR